MSLYHPSNPAWEDVAGSAALKARLQESAWRVEHDADVRLRSMVLPFYPGHRLIMATCPHWRPASTALYWLVDAENIYRLNGTSPPIHEANAKSGQQITEATAQAYMTFFSFFVRGADGPFAVIESLDDPLLPSSWRGADGGTSAEGADSRDRRLLALRLQSPRYFGQGEDGKFRLSACIIYSNAFFVADVLIQPGGMVEMENDTPLIADMAFKIEAPVTLGVEFQPEAATTSG